MIDAGEFMALMLIWLAFMAVIGVYVVRIGLMLREQRIMERAYLLRLATLRGKAAREMASAARVEHLGRQPFN